jgi:hypothetical protein
MVHITLYGIILMTLTEIVGFTHAEYGDCISNMDSSGNATAATKEYQRLYPHQRQPNRYVFAAMCRSKGETGVPMLQVQVFHTVCGMRRTCLVLYMLIHRLWCVPNIFNTSLDSKGDRFIIVTKFLDFVLKILLRVLVTSRRGLDR